MDDKKRGKEEEEERLYLPKARFPGFRKEKGEQKIPSPSLLLLLFLSDKTNLWWRRRRRLVRWHTSSVWSPLLSGGLIWKRGGGTREEVEIRGLPPLLNCVLPLVFILVRVGKLLSSIGQK